MIEALKIFQNPLNNIIENSEEKNKSDKNNENSEDDINASNEFENSQTVSNEPKNVNMNEFSLGNDNNQKMHAQEGNDAQKIRRRIL
jgi:hypothetical protein